MGAGVGVMANRTVGNGRLGLHLIIALAWCAGVAGADQELYSLEILDGQAASFEVPFEVEHPGEVAVHANWTGTRSLAFRIEHPQENATTIRRNGPSPIHITMNVSPEQLGQGPWKLIIRTLPVRGEGQGRLTIDLPGAHSLEPKKEIPKTGLFPPPPKKPMEEWQRPRPQTEGLSNELLRLVRETEAFREILVDSKPRAPDTCRWQDDLLLWLATRRDLAVDQGIDLDPATGKLMDQMAQVIRAVDEVRASRDPLLVGPPPTNRGEHANWARLRSNRLIPVENELDDLFTSVRRDRAPELDGETWPLRLVSCLTASERYFEQRWIDGKAAPNRDLAEAQWRPLNQAAGALEALARLADEEPIVLPSRR